MQTKFRAQRYSSAHTLRAGSALRDAGAAFVFLGFTFSALGLVTMLGMKAPTLLTVVELRDAYGALIATGRMALQAILAGGIGMVIYSIFRNKASLPASIAVVVDAIAKLLSAADMTVSNTQYVPVSIWPDAHHTDEEIPNMVLGQAAYSFKPSSQAVIAAIAA